MTSFIRRHLDPATRLGEVLFGLIMALCFTGAVRLGHEQADNRELFVGILGCNLAWAIVDGVMYVLTALFERGRRARVLRDARAAASEEEALRRIGDELEDRMELRSSPEERGRIERLVLDVVRRQEPAQARLHREDFLGGAAAGLVILLATLPVLVPFLVFSNPNLAVRISNSIALAELFLLGAQWGRTVGSGALRIGGGLTVLGVALVLITIALGG
jgi:VIT1/CCC1 family predicted Fe2+/Mn2+ transporter